MKLEDQVISLEIAKRLKELGVKQDSLFYWHNEKLACPEYQEYNIVPNNWYSAFTVAELGEMLPDKIKDDDGDDCFFFHDKFNGCHRIFYIHQCDEICSPFVEVKGETEANARGKILIYLIENKLIEV